MAIEVKDHAGRTTAEDPTAPPSVIILGEQLLDPVPDVRTYDGTMIKSVLRNAEYGHLADQLKMYSRMIEADTHLSSIVQTRRLAAKKAGIQILPPEGLENDKRALDAVAYVQELTRNMIGWKDLIPAMIDGPVKGFYAAEIVWDGPVPIAVLDTPEVVWRWNKGLQYRAENGTYHYCEPDKYIVHAPRGNSAVFTRRGVMRSCCKWWLIKNVGTRDWAAFCEIFGIPFRAVHYPQSMSPKDPTLAEVISQIKLLGASGIIAIREDFQVELMSSSGTGKDGTSAHEPLVRWCDAQMSKAILGQTLTVDTAQATGTYAAATVHNEVRLELAQSDVEGIGDRIAEDLFRPAVLYGLGTDYPTPRCVLVVEDPKDETARAGVLSVARNELGLPIEKATAYENLRIPVPPEDVKDEDLLEGEAKPATPIPFRRDRNGGVHLLAAENGTTKYIPEAQLALDALADAGADAWAAADRDAIFETVLAIVDQNPGISPDDLLKRLAGVYEDADPEPLAELLTETMFAATTNAGFAIDQENPDAGPDDDESDEA